MLKNEHPHKHLCSNDSEQEITHRYSGPATEWCMKAPGPKATQPNEWTARMRIVHNVVAMSSNLNYILNHISTCNNENTVSVKTARDTCFVLSFKLTAKGGRNFVPTQAGPYFLSVLPLAEQPSILQNCYDTSEHPPVHLSHPGNRQDIYLPLSLWRTMLA